MSPKPEPVQVIKKRRDEALASLVASVPYIQFMGVHFDRRGDELTAVMPFQEMMIGNPALPALHGGATAAFLEIAAIIEQPEPGAPFGAKGIGEPPSISSTAAVVAAIREATNLELPRVPVRFTDIVSVEED